MSTAKSATESNVDDVNAMTPHDVSLIQWEELALAVEEHYHAQELHDRNPDGAPMGHR
tara:strand:- start:290 stop:463 length:174 start_codon:yes stop_codon:yes gene_type:complete